MMNPGHGDIGVKALQKSMLYGGKIIFIAEGSMTHFILL